MSIEEQLARLDQLAVSRHIEMPAPATDDQIEALRSALYPMALPDEVVSLYTWHNGCRLPFLDLYGLRSIEETLDDRWFDDEDSDAPPAVLFLSVAPGGTGAKVGVTLDVPGLPHLAGVWSFDTHDQFASRMYDSLAHALCTYADIADDLGPATDPLEVFFGKWHGPRAVDEYRLPGHPTVFRWPDPPTGSQTSRFRAATWPAQWTASLDYS